MKRKYEIRRITGGDLVTQLQKVCDELSEEGWILQDVRMLNYVNGLLAVFYKDIEE